MTDRGYRGGGTLGGKWGCGIAALVGLPLLSLAILVSALGDCIPDARCDHDIEWQLILGALAIALVIGTVVRLLINQFAKRRGEDR